MADKKAKKKEAGPSKRDYFEIKGDKIERKRQHCPKCGPGTFLAVHKNRTSCGRCGYTEFAKK